MTRILTLSLAIAISFSAFSQNTQTSKTTTTPKATPAAKTSNAATGKTCEERNLMFREKIGTLSAALVYNTYLGIGAITDGYVSKAYDEARVNELFDEQKSLIANVDAEMNKMITEKALDSQDDIEYTKDVSAILKGLTKQINAFQAYLKDKSETRTTAYDTQRKENWAKISELLGLQSN